jgi:L-alanine-DL-glutamate epimerase-like enolase superfamily enzyme
MLIDVALWDLRGKDSVSRCGAPGRHRSKPVPLTWIAHGNTREAMVDEARRMAEERGYRGIKLKTWKRSMEDIEMVAEVGKLLPKAVLYVDGNGIYTESETRTILVHVKDHNVAFMEEPCKFTDISRQAAMAAFLPVALLGDQCCEAHAGACPYPRELRRRGQREAAPHRHHESLKIIALCEAAGLPVVIGTDSESRIGSLVRMHLRSAIPSLQPWPTETHFFDKLGDDTFVGDFTFADGTITPTGAPGFGAALDRRKIERTFWQSHDDLPSEAGNFSIAVAGDCMLTARVFDEPSSGARQDLHVATPPPPISNRWCGAGTARPASPGHLHDDAAGAARRAQVVRHQHDGLRQQHAFDYGEGGLLATIRHLDAAGIAHAGNGANLAEARMPGYLDTRGGRVAILSTTATFRPWNRAGAQRPDMRGRPGINPFSFKNTYTVDGEAFEQLKRISAELGFEQKRTRQRRHFFSDSEVGAERDEMVSLLNETFVRGNGFKVASEGDTADSKAICVPCGARRQADWVVVHFTAMNMATQPGLGKTRQSPSNPTSHALSHARRRRRRHLRRHGSHTPLGIELYNGKPIIFSRQPDHAERTLPFFPAVAYERFGLGDATRPTSSTPAPAAARRATWRMPSSGRTSRPPATIAPANLKDPHPPGRPGLRPPARPARPRGAGDGRTRRHHHQAGRPAVADLWRERAKPRWSGS